MVRVSSLLSVCLSLWSLLAVAATGGQQQELQREHGQLSVEIGSDAGSSGIVRRQKAASAARATTQGEQPAPSVLAELDEHGAAFLEEELEEHSEEEMDSDEDEEEDDEEELEIDGAALKDLKVHHGVGEVSHVAFDDFDKDEAMFKRVIVPSGDPALLQHVRNTCRMTLAKVMKMLDFKIRTVSLTNNSLSKEEMQTYADIKIAYANGEDFSKVHDLVVRGVSMVDLQTAVQAGEIWTMDDHELMLNSCYSKDPQDKLEERTRTNLGEFIVQGDMVIRPDSGATALWENGQVKYCLKANLKEAAKKSFLYAIDHVSSQVPCISFTEVPFNNATKLCESDGPAVIVQSDAPGCWSHVGAGPKPANPEKPSLIQHAQKLNLGFGCELQGEAIHQLCQTLGMVHEQARKDRDQYLKIASENTDAALFEVNFPTNDGVTTGHPFDFFSIMLGNYRAFSKNGGPTMEPKPSEHLQKVIGQRMALSQNDVEQLGRMYGCQSKVKPSSLTKDLAYRVLLGEGMVADGSCKDANYTGLKQRNWTNGVLSESEYHCKALNHLCQDEQYGGRVRSTCPQTCLMCVPVLTEEQLKIENEQRQAITKGSGKFFDNWLGHHAHYEAKVQYKATTTSTTEAPWAPARLNASTGQYEWDPSQPCQDKPMTDIKFMNGPRATCFELTNYCNHPTLGNQVKNTCPETCGLCGLETRRQWIGNWVAKNRRCTDLNATDSPQITLGGAMAACSELKPFCTGHPDSRYVMMKCAGTCELCSESAANKEEVSTPSIPFSSTAEPTEVQNKEYGCARRRRWGFCYTRRRRIH